jgi:uncharacterized protein
MKFQPDKTDAQTVRAFGPGWVDINGERIDRSIVIGSRGQRFDWPAASFDELGAHHFELLAGLQPELVVFGSGARFRFPRPEWLQSLFARRIGLETMDSAAACRTYNILAAEGRDVVLALLVESAPPG